MFIEMSAHTSMNIRVCIVIQKKIKNKQLWQPKATFHKLQTLFVVLAYQRQRRFCAQHCREVQDMYVCLQR